MLQRGDESDNRDANHVVLLLPTAVPRRFIDVAERLVLAGYENPEDLEPSEWYVSAVRAKFGLAALTGAVVLALEYGGRDGADDAAPDDG